MEAKSLCWQDLQFMPANARTKLVLSSGVSGRARTGRTFAIMGPSGDAATCAQGKLSGRITFEGHPCQASAIREQSCLVRQADVLLATATVRETLLFHALLQLPRRMARAVKEARVEQVLGLLELTGCANTMVGDHQAGIKGISGGERRRLALGIQLIKEPAIIFIDEPTTGLDSETALQVMQYIASLAHDHGRMVVFNIHQPNSSVAALFDDMLLLAPGGRAVYSGDSRAALGMFEGLGHVLPCFTAPCDFYMALMANEATVAQLAGWWAGQEALLYCGADPACGLKAVASMDSCRSEVGTFMDIGCDVGEGKDVGGAGLDVEKGGRLGHGLLFPAGRGSVRKSRAGLPAMQVLLTADTGSRDAAREGSDHTGGTLRSSRGEGFARTPGRLDTIERQTSNEMASSSSSSLASTTGGVSGFHSGPIERRERPSWWFEVWVLAQRSFSWWWRNPAMLLSGFMQYLLICLILGSIYWRVGSKLPSGAYDRMGGLFALMLTVMYTTASHALVAWDKERRLLKWELSNNTYRLSSFLVSKLMVSLPLEAGQVVVVSTMYYFMVGLARTWSQYWSCMAIFALLAVNADILGHMAIVITPDTGAAIPVLSVTLTLLLVFCGFVVQDIPVYWRWTQKVSCCSYAFGGLVLNEFQDLTLQLPGATNVNTPALGAVPGAVGLDRFATVGAFILVLLGVTGVTLVLAVAATLLVVRYKLTGF